MLNPKTGQRELCYVVTIDDIRPIEGKDRVECAVVGGWTTMVRKSVFKPGDLGIYFEIDSKVPATEEFKFLAPKKYKIKTQKYGNFYSQGLLMSASDFGGELYQDGDGTQYIHINGKSYGKGEFLTEVLGVTYASAADNERKKRTTDKYKRMSQRLGAKANIPFYKWMYQREWGKKVLYLLYGKKKDNRSWPQWVKKTDEERIENCLFYLNNKNPWIASEKIDGTSTTFTIKRKGWLRKNKFYVCSRNVVFDEPNKQCFYETNVYQEMALKYDIAEKMELMLKQHPEWEWITIQGETYGGGPLGNIQKNTYGLSEHRLAVFNLITSDRGRWNSLEMIDFLKCYNIPCVPILDDKYILPDTIEELRAYVHSMPSVINNEIKEGIVFRSLDGICSFKCVDPEYLILMH